MCMALALNALPSYAEAFSAPASTSIFSNAPMPYALDAVSRVPAPRMVIFPSLYRAYPPSASFLVWISTVLSSTRMPPCAAQTASHPCVVSRLTSLFRSTTEVSGHAPPVLVPSAKTAASFEHAVRLAESTAMPPDAEQTASLPELTPAFTPSSKAISFCAYRAGYS